MSRQFYYHGNQHKYGNEKAKRVVDGKASSLTATAKHGGLMSCGYCNAPERSTVWRCNSGSS